MGVHRQIFGRMLRIELAMRGAQPAERDRSVVELGVIGEGHQLPGLVEFLDGDIDVEVVGTLGRDPELELHMADELGRLVERDVEGGARRRPRAFEVVGDRRRLGERASASVRPALASR